MLSKNLILGLLAVWLLGSAWWQYFVIMKCKTVETAIVNSDSLAAIRRSDSLAALTAADTIQLATPAAGITEDSLANQEKYSSILKPMNLYFRIGETGYIKTEENKKFIDDAKAYLAEHKDKKLSLTGHSDSDGPDEMNQTLSEKRANAVEKQITASGFAKNQLSTDAKGEKEPIATNETPEGKKANRRVSIVVNQ